MSKNVKDALSSVGEIVRTGCQFVQLHPNGSGTAAFFLALYLVCPFGFKFLTYSITMFYVVAVMIKVIANSEPRDVHHGADNCVSKNLVFPLLKSDSMKGGSAGRVYEKPKISTQMSKRRNFKIRIEDLETLDDAERKQVFSSLLSEENLLSRGEREMKLKLSSWPSDRDDSIKQNEKEDCGMLLDKGIVAQQGESSPPGEDLVAGTDADNLDGDESILDFAPETRERNRSREGSRSHSEGEDGSEEAEDAQHDKRQAVEWTEDDQQNLTDLGLSEIERNKRLENLIAKRRAKKALSMKARDDFLDLGIYHPGPIPPVNITKKTFVSHHLAGDCLDSHLPGSAPSVLLPERSPFDLPYDSNEEKPNLTVDSFSAEILAPHPKDILSRHESVLYGPSFMPGFDEDLGPVNSRRFSPLDKRNEREPRHSRFRQKSDKDPQGCLVEEKLPQGDDPDPRQNEGTTNMICENLEASPDEGVIEKLQEDVSVEEDTVTESVSSTSEDQDEVMETLKDSDFSFQAISPRLVRVLSYDSGRPATEHMNGRTSHTSTFSIASDMQVELSGSSTPRTLADYTPDDAESLTHDGDMDGQSGFTNDEIWGALSKHNDIITLDLPESREDEERSKENNSPNYNSMNNPFGSYISLMELDREEFHLRQHLQRAPSPESCGYNHLEVSKSRFDDPSNGNISESIASEVESCSVQSASDHTHSERDEEVK